MPYQMSREEQKAIVAKLKAEGRMPTLAQYANAVAKAIRATEPKRLKAADVPATTLNQEA